MKETLSSKKQIFEGWHSKENRFFHISHVRGFIQKIEEIITRKCMGTSANCYEIKKEIREEAGEELTK